MFSGGIKRDQWHEMVLKRRLSETYASIAPFGLNIEESV